MIKRYFDDPKDNAAFERCIDVLAELIEKYAGRFALSDIGYEYYLMLASAPLVSYTFSFEDYRNRFSDYFRRSNNGEKYFEQNDNSRKCQKAS